MSNFVQQVLFQAFADAVLGKRVVVGCLPVMEERQREGVRGPLQQPPTQQDKTLQHQRLGGELAAQSSSKIQGAVHRDWSRSQLKGEAVCKQGCNPKVPVQVWLVDNVEEVAPAGKLVPHQVFGGTIQEMGDCSTSLAKSHWEVNAPTWAAATGKRSL